MSFFSLESCKVLLELFHELCRVQMLGKDLQTLLDTRVAAVEVSSLQRGNRGRGKMGGWGRDTGGEGEIREWCAAQGRQQSSKQTFSEAAARL